MNIKLIVDGKEIEIEVSEEELANLIASTNKKRTGYERVSTKDFFYFDDGTSLVNEVIAGDHFNIEDEEALYNAANYYSSREVAENNARADKLMRNLRRLAAKHRQDIIDWGDPKDKYTIVCYHHGDGTAFLDVDTVENVQNVGGVYFDLMSTAHLAIETFAEDLMWYFTEYKDRLYEI